MDGQKIPFNGEGDQTPGVTPGDVIIQLEEKPHPSFKRKGADLFVEVKLDLLTALAGGQFAVTHLDDRVLHVTILPGEVIKPGEVKSILNEGMPVYKRPYDKGTLFVKFDIEFPAPGWCPVDKLKMLETVLPPRKDMPKIGAGVEVEEVMLANVDPMHERKSRGEDAMDEDDEGGHGHGPQVQCAQQVGFSCLFLFCIVFSCSFSYFYVLTQLNTEPVILSILHSDEFYVVITFICCWLKSGLGGEESQFFFTLNLYKREIKKRLYN